MSNGYQDVSDHLDGDIIFANDDRAEFAKLDLAFDEVNGHVHDGSPGQGARIPSLADPSGVKTLVLDSTGAIGTVVEATEVTAPSVSVPKLTTDTSVKLTVDAAALVVQTASNLVQTNLDDYETSNDAALVTEATRVDLAAANDLLLAKAMTKAEFDMRAEGRKDRGAGSGFEHWGKHATDTATFPTVNEGIWQSTLASTLVVGGKDVAGFNSGISLTASPKVTVNGHQHLLSNVSSTDALNNINFPPAPNGLQNIDGVTADFADLAAAVTSGGTSLSNSVLSRQDLVFLEIWHEKISGDAGVDGFKDVVYPLGNVQFGASTHDGISLLNTVEVQGYSAFGDWDTVTKGFGAVWSTLALADQIKLIQNKDSNIYRDGEDLIQVRYRIRVVRGLGDSWENVQPMGANWLVFKDSAGQRVLAQGIEVTPSGLGAADVVNKRYIGTQRSEYPSDARGIFVSNGATSVSHTSTSFAVPIALVERRNQGAYDPVFNSEGTANFSDGNPWFSTATSVTSTSIAFSAALGTTGAIGQTEGRPDDKFYDAIFAGDVQDLRMSSRALPLSEVREKYKRKAIAGTVRGFEAVPFTTVIASTNVGAGTGWSGVGLGDTASVGSVIHSVTLAGIVHTAKVVARVDTGTVTVDISAADRSGNVVAITNQTHNSAEPTWTDIIGDPSFILATFPNGVEGQWIPVVTAFAFEYPLNRKVITGLPGVFTLDNGASWTPVARTLTTTTNTAFAGGAAAVVELYQYKTQAHFTSDSVNSEVLDLGMVEAGNYFQVGEPHGFAHMTSTLIDKVATNSSLTSPIKATLTLNKYSIRGGNKLEATADHNTFPTHDTIALSGIGPAVKTLDYLTQSNSRLRLSYAYKEMVFDSTMDTGNEAIDASGTTSISFTAGVHYQFTSGNRLSDVFLCINNITVVADTLMLDPKGNLVGDSTGNIFFTRWDGNGWGDDNQFQIVDNQSSRTDDNGKTTLFGTASFDTQYFHVPT